VSFVRDTHLGPLAYRLANEIFDLFSSAYSSRVHSCFDASPNQVSREHQMPNRIS
jgi:hypothetical protein